MFAIAFDLVVRETAARHPRSVSQACADIGSTLSSFGFYISASEDLANLFLAVSALRPRSWFPHCVRDIRAFRIEQWSDFTPIVRG